MIGVIRLNGKEYRLATYLGATAVRTDFPTVMVRQGGYRLCATLLEERAQPLLAPVNGRMNRTICESAACRAHYVFSRGGKVLWEGGGPPGLRELGIPEGGVVREAPFSEGPVCRFYAHDSCHNCRCGYYRRSNHRT